MLNSRFDELRDYPFQRLRALLDVVAPPAGLAPINLTIGEPQHAYPDFVGEVLRANRHLYGKYPPQAGTPELRQAIAAWLTRRYRLKPGAIEPDRHVIPLNGTREGLFMIALAAVPESKGGGRPVALMPNPFYQVYAGAALAAGAEPVFLPALPERGFLPDLDAVPRATLERTALLYLCSPANPQGNVASLDYLRKAIVLARQYDFILVCDECYAEIYDAAPPPGGLEAAGDDFSNVVAFHSLSKRSSVPGLRSGFCAGDPKLMAAFAKLRTYGGAPLPLPICAASVALWQDEAHVEANRALYRQKFDAAQRIIGNRFGFYRPAGGFYLWLDMGDGEAAARKLWTEAGVRALPGKYLTKETGEAAADAAGVPYLRFAMVESVAATTTAMERIAETFG